MIRLYSAEVCPFAQRTRALLTRMDVDFELREIDLTDKPEDFLERSPTGKVPMLEEDGFVLYESQVINDYLAERLGWEDAYPGDPRAEARQKVVMKQWDSAVLPPFYAGLSDPEHLEEARGEVEPELEQFQRLVQETRMTTDSLLGFHVAPFWARMSWLSEYTDFPDWVDQFGALREWLDGTLEEPPIVQTLPDRESTVATYREHYVDAA